MSVQATSIRISQGRYRWHGDHAVPMGEIEVDWEDGHRRSGTMKADLSGVEPDQPMRHALNDFIAAVNVWLGEQIVPPDYSR